MRYRYFISCIQGTPRISQTTGEYETGKEAYENAEEYKRDVLNGIYDDEFDCEPEEIEEERKAWLVM